MQHVNITCPRCGSSDFATREIIPGTCNVSGFHITKGALFHQYSNSGTDVDWDGQKTETQKTYMCNDCGGTFDAAELVATVPEDLRAQIISAPASAAVPDRLEVLRGMLVDLAAHAGAIERKQREAGPVEPEEWHRLRVLVREAEILTNGSKPIAPELLDEATLCAELESYCNANGLPFLSADELAASDHPNDEQREWLRDFCARWDRWEDQQSAAAAHLPLYAVECCGGDDITGDLWRFYVATGEAQPDLTEASKARAQASAETRVRAEAGEAWRVTSARHLGDVTAPMLHHICEFADFPL